MDKKQKFLIEQEAERMAYEQRANRDRGLELAKVRDAGYVMFRPVHGDMIGISWNTENHAPYPKDCFAIHVKGKTLVLEAEEFRKVLRWV